MGYNWDAHMRDRETLFAELHRESESALRLREITTPLLARRSHRNWVFDATLLPTGSHYVPPLLRIVENYERAGRIAPETHALVETSTGNACAAAAYIATRLGYPIICFLPAD